MELLFLIFFDQVNLVPDLNILLLEHIFRQTNFFDHSQHCLFLEISLRMANVSDMDQ